MKKFLFAIAALAMGLTASAQIATGSYDSTEGTLTLGVDELGDGDFTAISFYCKTSDGITISTAKKVIEFAEYIDEDFTCPKTYSATSNKTGYGVFNIYSPDTSDKDILLQNGMILSVPVILADESTTGTIQVATVMSTRDSKSTPLDEITVSVGSTAVKNVNAAEAAAAPNKYIENGQVVIVKGDKKFNAAGSQIK